MLPRTIVTITISPSSPRQASANWMLHPLAPAQALDVCASVSACQLTDPVRQAMEVQLAPFSR